jgi:hypothetical protein
MMRDAVWIPAWRIGTRWFGIGAPMGFAIGPHIIIISAADKMLFSDHRIPKCLYGQTQSRR